MTRDLVPREIDLYDPTAINTYKGFLQIMHGFVKKTGGVGTHYIFTCKGVDVSAWRKNSNSDKLEDDLKLELARKIGKEAKNMQHEGGILLEIVPVPKGVKKLRRGETKLGKPTFSIWNIRIFK